MPAISIVTSEVCLGSTRYDVLKVQQAAVELRVVE
jgi:hypothetical protein